MSADDLDLMTLDDIARILNQTPRWVQQQCRTGRISSLKVGRKRLFTVQDVADYLESVRQQAANPMARNARQVAARKRRRSA